MKRRSDGRWQKRITLPDGRSKLLYSTAPSERLAIKEFNEIMLSYKETAKTATHFNVVAQEWSEHHFPALENNTLKQYRPCLASAIDFFKNTPVETLKPSHIQNYIDSLKKKNLAGKTIKNRLLVLNLILKHAILKDYIIVNPCDKITLPKNLPKNKREKASISDEKVICEHTDSLFGILAYLILTTGCRRGEAVALTPQDIDFETHTIKINKTVEWLGNVPQMKLTPKTEAGKREIPVGEKLLNLLKPFMAQKYIFMNPGGGLISNSQFTREWNKYQKEANIKCTPHQLRHSYATLLFDAGIDVKTAQRWLGHKDIKTTLEIYTHLSEKRVEETSAKLKAFLSENY